MSDQKFRLDISVSIRQDEPYQTGYLEIRETLNLNADGFMEVAGILSRFHELAERLKADQ